MDSPNFLVHAPAMTYQDLDFELDITDFDAIGEFEDAWKKFLLANPAILPTGQKKGKRIQGMERNLQDIRKSKQNVELELQRQLEFFSKSKDQLETDFQKSMTSAAMNQQKVHADLNKQIDNVAVAGHNILQTLPWECFLDVVDQAVEDAGVQPLPDDLRRSSASSTTTNSKSMKPSARAMYLINHNGQNAKDAHSQDFLLRAYRTDHALLKAQIKMLQREVEPYDKTTDSLEFLGKFLTEHNIWGLLTKPPGNNMRIAQ